MEQFDELQALWQKNTIPQAPAVSKENVAAVIASSVRKEKKKLVEYFWASLGYQIMIYSFACFLAVKYRGDMQVVVLCAIGALMFIPFTIVLMRKFKAMFKPAAENATDIQANIRRQSQLLTQFFRVKKVFDFISIPVYCFIMDVILFKLYTPGGIEAHMPLGIGLYVLGLLVFGIAARLENRKHFVKPLQNFALILEDMEKVG